VGQPIVAGHELGTPMREGGEVVDNPQGQRVTPDTEGFGARGSAIQRGLVVGVGLWVPAAGGDYQVTRPGLRRYAG